MAVTISDVLQLDILKAFKLVAGAGGLSRTITATEILDFEFMEEGVAYRERGFDGNSIVLTSLLFAKDKPDAILDALQRLIRLNVQALAYKPVFFQTLPREVLDYAEAQNFPILEFGRDEFFEDVIFGIRALVERDDLLGQTEPLIGEMVCRACSEAEAEQMHERMNPQLRPVVAAVCLRDRNLTREQLAAKLRRGRPDERLQSRTFVGKYRDTCVVVLSQDEPREDRFRAQLQDVCIAYGLDGDGLTAGASDIRRIDQHFDLAIREAYWAEKVAEIEEKPVKRYRDLGMYQLIISCIHVPAVERYAARYLAPLLEEEARESELLRTAVAYVQAEGDANLTAERLFCHKNTIRYRIGKLQEKLEPDSTEKTFYQDLALAVKIYLLMQEKDRRE